MYLLINSVRTISKLSGTERVIYIFCVYKTDGRLRETGEKTSLGKKN